MDDVLNTLDTYARTFKFIDVSEVVKPEVRVDGMSKYTENSFGYTFWYPSDWTVSEIAVQNENKYKGGLVKKTLKISKGVRSVYIDQFYSNVLPIEEIDNKVPAKVSKNTMGGLRILNGSHPFFSNKIIQLNSTIYLIVETAFDKNNNDYMDLLYGLVGTIGATDPSVATAVNEYDQIGAIQYEKDEYKGVSQ